MQYGSIGNNQSCFDNCISSGSRREGRLKCSDRSMAIMPTAAARAQPEQEQEKAETCYPKGEQHPRQQIHENAGQSRFLDFSPMIIQLTAGFTVLSTVYAGPLSLVLTMYGNVSLGEGTATVPGHRLTDDNQANGRRRAGDKIASSVGLTRNRCPAKATN